MNLNLEQLAAGLDSDTFGWQTKGDSIEVWRWYGQRMTRPATYWEPAEYTNETSESVFVRAEGYTVIISDENGKEIDRDDSLADMIDAQIPWRDLQKEADEAYGEWLIDRYEDQLYEKYA